MFFSTELATALVLSSALCSMALCAMALGMNFASPTQRRVEHVEDLAGLQRSRACRYAPTNYAFSSTARTRLSRRQTESDIGRFHRCLSYPTHRSPGTRC